MGRLSLAAAGGALAAIVVGSSNYAHAAPTTYEVTCGASTLAVGTYSRDRDVSVAVYYNHGGWSIAHTLNNGHVYERNEQYDLIDTTSGSTLTWTGHLRRNPALVMTGWIETGSNGQPVYVEHLTKDGQVGVSQHRELHRQHAGPNTDAGHSNTNADFNGADSQHRVQLAHVCVL